MFSFFNKYHKKKIGANKIVLRKNGVDKEVFDYVFEEKYHRPHIPLSSPAPIILDLGANIGLTVVDFKSVYPGARIYAYEMDRENFELARRNCQQLDEVFLFNSAVWFENTRLSYRKSAISDAYKLEDVGVAGVDIVEVPTVDIKTIIKEHSLKTIDYVKMDIEGAEMQIFQHDLTWLDFVQQLKIEIHYNQESFLFFEEKLMEKGFETERDTHHWSTIIAYRK